MSDIVKGQKVRIVAHFVDRWSPYVGRTGTVDFVPTDGKWPFIVSIPDYRTARNAKTTSGRRYPWPTVFARKELAPLVGELGDDSAPAPEKLNAAQLTAIRARSSTIDRGFDQPHGSSRRLAVEMAAEHFGREITDEEELTKAEASWVLDLLDKRFERFRNSTFVGAGAE